MVQSASLERGPVSNHGAGPQVRGGVWGTEVSTSTSLVVQGGTQGFSVKKLIKQLLIPPAAINRANNPVFGLWQKVRSFVASARCSTLEGGGARWLKGGCPHTLGLRPAPLCLPCYAFEHPVVEASVHSHWHSLLRKEGKKHHQLHFMVEEIGIQKCSGICPGGILLITLLSTLAPEPRSCIFCSPQALSPVLQRLCS